MDKMSLLNAVEHNCKLAQRALMFNPRNAQEYFEKVQHLHGILNMVMDFETQLISELDVDD